MQVNIILADWKDDLVVGVKHNMEHREPFSILLQYKWCDRLLAPLGTLEKEFPSKVLTWVCRLLNLLRLCSVRTLRWCNEVIISSPALMSWHSLTQRPLQLLMLWPKCKIQFYVLRPIKIYGKCCHGDLLGEFFLLNKASERAQWDTQSRCLILKGQFPCLDHKLSRRLSLRLVRCGVFRRLKWSLLTHTQSCFVAAIIKTYHGLVFKMGEPSY